MTQVNSLPTTTGARIKIFNGRIITPFRMIKSGCILITGNKITEVSDSNIDAPGATEIDAGGKYITPGFIDIHVHGGGGHDFMDGTAEACREIALLHARHGTTSLNPTTLSAGKEALLRSFAAADTMLSDTHQGARNIGLHIEGPYFAMTQRGAQDTRYIRNPDPKEYEQIIASSKNIRRWSAAPELPGALEFGAYLRSQHILAALAHTDAVYEEVLKAFEYGYVHATHLYSSMSGVTRKGVMRFAGAIESAFLIDEMTVEIIADGIHLPAPLLKLVYKIKGADQTALITDAMRGAGMPPGESMLGSLDDGLKVIIEDDVAKLPDRSAFAGSIATADRLVRNMINMADVPICDAVRMMTATPARIMKVDDDKGSLLPGKDADIIIFDKNINVQMTMIAGKII